MFRDRLLWLVLAAMVMFAAGGYVLVFGIDHTERILGGVAVLSAITTVVSNLPESTPPHAERRDYGGDRGEM